MVGTTASSTLAIIAANSYKLLSCVAKKAAVSVYSYATVTTDEMRHHDINEQVVCVSTSTQRTRESAL